MAAVKKTKLQRRSSKEERASYKITKETLDGSWKPCRWYDDDSGTVSSEFAGVSDPPPEVIATRWGRGRYRLMWFSKTRKAMGTSAILEIANPELEDRGTYPNEPRHAPPPTASPDVAPPSVPVSSLDEPPAGLGLVDVRMFAYLHGLAHQGAQLAIERERAICAREVAQIQASAAVQIAQQSAFWKAQTEVARPPVDLALVERVGALEAIEDDEDDEDDEPADEAPKGTLEALLADPSVAAALQQLKPLLPLVVTKIGEYFQK